MNENKTSRYLKYAIGEILLVMIGILLALQVNNWNEQRKLRQQELDALVEVRSDLVNTMWDIDNNLTKMTDWLESAWKIKRLINTSDEFPDSLGSDLVNVTLDEFLYPSSKAYTALKSAGFKLIKNEDIQRRLDRLYARNYPRLQMSTSIEPDIQTYFSDYVKNNFQAVSQDTLYNSGRKAEDLSGRELFQTGHHHQSLHYAPNDYAQFKKDTEFQILLENTINWRMMKILRYRGARTNTDETIDLIEKYISGKIKLSQTRNLAYLLDYENGIDHILDIIQKGDTDDQGYNISEAAINSLGYRLIRGDRPMDALKILKLNTEIYPNAFNTFDSYGEILLVTGDTANAIKAYEKSLELNPENENAKKVLLELK